VIKPFRIDIPQADLDDLADRLGKIRWPDELPDAKWDYGIPLDRVKELAEHWRTKYNWRDHEATLNTFPHYITEIDGQTIHFLHVRSPNPDALPLILTHGWPGSFLEFLDVIPLLSEDFHLVIPSIPGFAFSGPTRDRGWDVHRVARAWAELMHRLGYHRYGAQGGDFGSSISRALGGVAPEHVVGVHVNYLPMVPPEDKELDLSEKDQARLEHIKQFVARRPGYQELQSTKPQSLAYALTDSPVGQLAWIAERFDEWVDPTSGIDIDTLLTNVMLYWLTGTAGSSARLSRESTRGPISCPAPIGVAVLPRDITLAIRPFAEQEYEIVHWSEFDRGGHFAALEAPDLFSADVRAFFLARRPEPDGTGYTG
jgi:pimeloyl-ACP methyl ester carboxylesterase